MLQKSNLSKLIFGAFSGSDPHFYYRFILSDGVCKVKAIISETVLSKMRSLPRALDIIKVPYLKKIEVSKNGGKDMQWLI